MSLLFVGLLVVVGGWRRRLGTSCPSHCPRHYCYFIKHRKNYIARLFMSNNKRMPKRTDTLALFDVDGTLTPSRCVSVHHLFSVDVATAYSCVVLVSKLLAKCWSF